MWKSLILAAVLAIPAGAQPEAKPPTDQQILPLYERCLQLIEAGGLASPELGRAGVPLAENMRMALESLKFLGVRQPQLHYRFLANLRAYLLLAESVPKPVTTRSALKRISWRRSSGWRTTCATRTATTCAGTATRTSRLARQTPPSRASFSWAIRSPTCGG